jgi:hypothetical protein
MVRPHSRIVADDGRSRLDGGRQAGMVWLDWPRERGFDSQGCGGGTQ